MARRDKSATRRPPSRRHRPRAGHEEQPPEPTRRYSPDAEMAAILYRAAQQPQPQRIEDVWRQRTDKGEASPDAPPAAPAASADAPAAAPAPLPTGEWLAVTACRLRDEGKYLKDTQKSELCEVLAAASRPAVKAGELGHTLEPGYLKKIVKPLGIWPLNSLG